MVNLSVSNNEIHDIGLERKTDQAELVFSISHEEFSRISDYLKREIGIQMSLAKKQMVASRLARRLQHYNLSSYGEYFQRSISGEFPGEIQVMLNYLTTNETYLFREVAHFEFLRDKILSGWKRGRLFRAWSAACSSGEEAYSIAMVTVDHLGNGPWEITGTDFSTKVLEAAKKAVYPLERSSHIPHEYLTKYCLKGVRSHSGSLLVDKALRDRTRFLHLNLNKVLPEELGYFDVIFLRNVLIYFDASTRKEIVKRVLKQLNPGGYFIISLTENLYGLDNQLVTIKPSIYQKK